MTARKVEEAILRLLLDRVPNYVPEATILTRLKSFAAGDVSVALDELVARGQVDREDDPRATTGLATRFYRPHVLTGLPIRETIKVGDQELPRLLSDSQPKLFPEVFNEALEQVADYTRDLERRFTRLVRKHQRRYWANVAGLFGIFVSLLALILVGLPKIATDPSLPFWSVVQMNLAQVLPVAVVLAIFVVIVRIVIR